MRFLMIYPNTTNTHLVRKPRRSIRPSGSVDTEGNLGGSCLCGRVEFEVTEPFKKVFNCYCSRCRRARAAAFTTNGFTSSNGIRFVKGEQHLVSYKLPDARYFTHVFCDTCGSGLPRIDPERQITVVPFGALDSDPGIRASANIFVAHKADWSDVNLDLDTFNEAPAG